MASDAGARSGSGRAMSAGAWSALGAVAALLALIAIGASLGKGDKADTLTALGLVVSNVLLAGSPALALILACAGYGRLARPVFRDSTEAKWIQLGVGLAIGLSLIYLIGVLGLLSAPVAIGFTIVGLGLLGEQFVRATRLDTPSLSRMGGGWWAALPGVAILLVAAAAPPGWLWDSEFGGYDALSYHLQLPREWLESGRVEPLAHNVYSYLPSYVESAFAFMGAMTLAPGGELGAGSGWRLLSAHMLHAGLAVCTALMLGAFVRRALARVEVDGETARLAGSLAGALVLLTPWVVVVGSLAYNEMGVTALGAGAMLVAVEDRVRAPWRGALCGALVGVACGAKPTALLLVAPVVGVLLLGTTPARAWWRVVVFGVIAGVVALSPWLVRNWAHGGNPVFPQMTGIFGTAHWSEEQADRYHGAHSFDGSVMDRVRLLVWDNPAAPDTAASTERWRGAMHPQWFAFFPATLLAGGIGLACKRTRRMTAFLLAGLGTQAIAWGFGTHLQSRFLLPCVLTGAGVFGVALGGVRTRRARSPLVVAWMLVLGAQTVGLWYGFVGQRQGRPNFGLASGVGMWTGDPYNELVGAINQSAYINHELAPDAVVFMVGGATPLYVERGVVYATTWDTSALVAAIEEAPDDPAAWVAALRGRGVTHVLLEWGELGRLGASGWRDPRLTDERVRAWVETLGRPMRVWGAPGVPPIELYRIGQ